MHRYRIRIVNVPDRADQLRRATRLRGDLIDHAEVWLDPDHPLQGIHRDLEGHSYFEFAAENRKAIDRVLAGDGYSAYAELTEPKDPLGEPCQNCGNVAGPILPPQCPNCGFVDISCCPVAVHTPNNLYSRFVLLHMSQQLPLLEPLWSRVPADLQVTLLDGWKSLHDRIAELEATVRDLQARLQLNSTNSSKPPSSDPIGLKRKPPTPPSRRRRGGQPGHRKAFRALVPPEKLRSSTDCKPDACRRCGHALSGEDPDPLIHQVAELPRIEPIVNEYRLHRLACPDCGQTTCGPLPEGVPTVRFGPYLQATLATLAGAYRLSKRPIQQLAGDLFGLSISTGMISKLERLSAEALQAPYNELATAVHTAGVIGADETGWREDRHKAWLWAAVTALFTVFTIARNRNARVARAVLGTQDGPIAVTDRWSAYDWIAGASRPVCWSHLRRDFQAMIDRGGAAAPIGKKLLRLSDRLFRWWHRLEAKRVDWGRFRTAMARLRREFKTALEDGARCDCADPRDLRRAPAGRGEPVDLRAGRGCAADQQRRRARRAARGDLASDQRGNR